MTVSERNILNVICYGIVVVWVYYIAWYSVRIFLFDRFVIPTESMDPTLLPGDCIIVDKTIFKTLIRKI